MTTASPTAHLTEDEAALYDRQIRLWGLDAQRRLRSARILLAGIRGLGAEIAKNVMLAGVQSLTIIDHVNVSEEDRCSNFLVGTSDLGHNRAERALKNVQRLNPMVKVVADAGNVLTKPDEYFADFDVVCVTGASLESCARIDAACRERGVKFFAGDVFGFYGYMFTDLVKHEYVQEVTKHPKGQGKTSHPVITSVHKVMEFVPLPVALKYDWTTDSAKAKLKRTPSTYFIMLVLSRFQDKFSRRPSLYNRVDDSRQLLMLRDEVMEEMGLPLDTVSSDFTEYCFAELSPVCSIVGGVLAQEIIKAVSHKDKPHNNFFFFDGVTTAAIVDNIGQ